MKTLLLAAVGLSVLGGAAAQAQPYDRHDRIVERHDAIRADRHWARGQRLPREYWGGGYVVSDWRVRHLRPPPRGYHWVRVDNNYVLAAAATGLIADIIANGR